MSIKDMAKNKPETGTTFLPECFLCTRPGSLHLEIEKLLGALDKEWNVLASPARQWQTRGRSNANFEKGYAQALADTQARLLGILERAKQARFKEDPNLETQYKVENRSPFAQHGIENNRMEAT
jgi:hypothetical protein